jgi:DNA-binding beta-propeller fold protein YncE
VKFFFTAIDTVNGDPGVFAGCSPVSVLHVGDPLVAPFGIATGTDGSMLYVADSAYEPASGGIGTVWTLPAAGGALTSLAAAEGFAPRGLEVLSGAEGDEVVFTGRNPADGQPGLYKIVSGTLVTVAKGAPFVEPSGVAIVDENMMFVSDTDGTGDGLGAVIMVMGGTATVLAPSIGVGYPAGIAVTANGTTVLVSGIDPATKKDVVYLVDVATKAVSTFNDTIGTNEESAGLHRAKNSDVFAWADLSAGTTGGTVYKITLK